VVAQLAVRWMPSLIDAGSDDPEADREALRKLASRSPDVICENGVFYFCVSVKSPCFKSARDLVVDNKVFRAALVAGKRPLVAVTNTVWARNSKFQRMQLQSFEGLSGRWACAGGHPLPLRGQLQGPAAKVWGSAVCLANASAVRRRRPCRGRGGSSAAWLGRKVGSVVGRGPSRRVGRAGEGWAGER